MSAIAVHPNAGNLGCLAGHRTVSLQPFLDWASRRIEAYGRKYEGSRELDVEAHHRFLTDIGWADDAGVRRFFRYRYESVTGVARVDLLEDAVERVGLRIWDVYPEFDYGDPIDRWCGRCQEIVMTDNTWICPWCETPTWPVR